MFKSIDSNVSKKIKTEETCSRQTCTPTPRINQQVKFNTLTSKILSEHDQTDAI